MANPQATINRKTCSKCGVEMPVSEFYTNKGKPKNPCKGCKRAYRASDEGQAAKLRSDRAYEARHKERRHAQRNEIAKEHYRANRDAKIAYQMERFHASEMRAERARVLANSACSRCGVPLVDLRSDKCGPCRDLLRKLSHNASKYVWEALKLRGGKKADRTFKVLPYTPAELAAHLESRFEVGMTWDNYGEAWEIDHIKPRSFFKYELSRHPEVVADPSITSWDEIKRPMLHPDVVECNALCNLRPLWASENTRRGNRVDGGDVFIETMMNLREG